MLRAVALVYLAIPSAIFAVGWMRPLVAVVCSVALAIGTLDATQRGSRRTITTRQAVASVAAALVCLLFSGIGGLGVLQQPDWEKHNAILAALMSTWPTSVALPGEGSAPLVYYAAYLFPPALVGRAAGWTLANVALILWSGIGLALAFLQFTSLVNAHRCNSSWANTLIPPMTFALFSGMDVLGTLLIAPTIRRMYPFAFPKAQSLEFWGLGFQYSANATLVAWAPHQGIGGWLATGLMLADLEAGDRSRLVWYLALTALWSPFAVVGLTPFVLLDAVRSRNLRQYLTVANACGAVWLAVYGVFFAGKFVDLSAIAPMCAGGTPHGWALGYAQNVGEAVLLAGMIAVVCLLEFGLLAIACGRMLGWLGLTAIAILTVLPLYRFGQYNDLMLRASIPALFFLQAVAARTLLDGTRLRRQAVAVLLTLGAVTATVDYGAHARAMVENRAILRIPPAGEVRGLAELHIAYQVQTRGFPRGMEFDSFICQYVGRPSPLLFRLPMENLEFRALNGLR